MQGRLVLGGALITLLMSSCGVQDAPVSTRGSAETAPVRTVVVTTVSADSRVSLNAPPARPLEPDEATLRDVPPTSRTHILLSGPEPSVRHNAVQRAIEACMAAQGLLYRPWIVPPMHTERDVLLRTGFNIGQALHRVGPLPRPKLPPQPNVAHVNELSAQQVAAYQAALGNESESGGTGCWGSGSWCEDGRYDRRSRGRGPTLACSRQVVRLAGVPRGTGAIWAVYGSSRRRCVGCNAGEAARRGVLEVDL
jgi:hypothetical protein